MTFQIQMIQEGAPDGPDCLHCHLLPIVLKFAAEHKKTLSDVVFEVLNTAVDVHCNGAQHLSDEKAAAAIGILQKTLGEMLGAARIQIARAAALERAPPAGRG